MGTSLADNKHGPCHMKIIHDGTGTVETCPSAAPKSTALAQTTEPPNKVAVGRLGCGRQAGACAGWSLRSNGPSIKAVGFVGKGGGGDTMRVYL